MFEQRALSTVMRGVSMGFDEVIVTIGIILVVIRMRAVLVLVLILVLVLQRLGTVNLLLVILREPLLFVKQVRENLFQVFGNLSFFLLGLFQHFFEQFREALFGRFN